MKVKHFSQIEKEEVNAAGARGASIRWLLGPKDEMPNFHLRMVEVEPGGVTMHHDHPYEHEVYILEGEGELAGNDKSLPLKPGNAAYVAPGETHQFRNVGETPLRFLCVVPRLDKYGGK